VENASKGPLARCLAIRLFEQRLLQLYSQGHIFGTVHTCVGQEMVGVLAANHFQTGDAFVSNHRGHGHFLGLTGDEDGLLSEITGRQGAVCLGRGGTQHLYHSKGFYSNGIQGGMAPVATGLALARRISGTDNLVFLFIGDGTLGEGTLYEALNIAAKWNVPLLVILENNGIAQTTSISSTLAGSIEGRARALGLNYECASTRRWEELDRRLAEIVPAVREGTGPFLLEVETHRLGSHSKGDDTRPESEVKQLWENDPLQLWLDSEPEARALQSQLQERLDSLVAEVLGRPPVGPPSPSTIEVVGPRVAEPEQRGRVVEEVNRALKDMMAKRSEVVMLGEDILSPYGGAFKVSRDLSELFPERVLTTPISEASIVGIGTGLALSGFRPFVEIMFGDFLGLAFDQLVNHAAKFRFMYGGRVEVPLVVRTPMGGYRGYGPTHSQCLEKHLLGVPGLQVLALNHRVDPYSFYQNLARVDTPTLVIENKLLYGEFLGTRLPPGYCCTLAGQGAPTVVVSPGSHQPAITIVCYSAMLKMAESVLEELFHEHEILVELVGPTSLYPLDLGPIQDSVTRTQRLLILEEGLGFCAWGAEVAAQLWEQGVAPVGFRRVHATDFIPADRGQEETVLPSAARLKKIVLEFVHG